MLISLDYLVKKYSLKIDGILHIGACRLEELNVYTNLKINNIIWVEANKSLVIEMKKKYPNEKIFNICLGDNDNEIRNFMITNNEQSSSLLEFGTHKNEHPDVCKIKNVEVKTSTLDTFTNMIIGENFNFLNLDIQGAELMVLKKGVNTLKTIDYIYTEINVKELYKGCGLLKDLDDFLLTQGFERIETKLLKYGWGDAFYIRKHKII